MFGFSIIILLLFIIGVIIVTNSFTKMSFQCPKQNIEYKYRIKTTQARYQELSRKFLLNALSIKGIENLIKHLKKRIRLLKTSLNKVHH